ncbi:hypothetical protein ACW0TQ_06260 [Oceanobacillus sp. M60]|uniref:hypothetical protein n=1 Tax=Oceanobacillus oncorhynchi TaxID=545501 RepID=UPI001BB3B1B1|nr:hypothetical protein [Oceanobacillus oncorhynchi]
MVFGGTSNRSPSGKTPQKKSVLLFFYPQGISATLLLSAPVSLPISKSSFHPQGISATLLLSAPVGLPISKSSLKEMSSGPMESVVFFWGCDYSPHHNPSQRSYEPDNIEDYSLNETHWSGYIQHFLYTFLFFREKTRTPLDF